MARPNWNPLVKWVPSPKTLSWQTAQRTFFGVAIVSSAIVAAVFQVFRSFTLPGAIATYLLVVPFLYGREMTWRSRFRFLLALVGGITIPLQLVRYLDIGSSFTEMFIYLAISIGLPVFWAACDRDHRQTAKRRA